MKYFKYIIIFFGYFLPITMYSQTDYTYDNLNRLIQIDDHNRCSFRHFTYDSDGNRIADDFQYISYNLSPYPAYACPGGLGTITISATNPNSNYTFSWSNGTVGNTLSAPVGTYTVIIADVATGKWCKNDGIIIANNYVVGPLGVNYTNNFCTNGSTGSAQAFTMGGSGSYTYSWSNGQIMPNINNLTSGNYTVWVTETTSGCVQSQTITITEPAQISNTIIQSTIPCAGGTTNVTINTLGGAGGFQYSLDVSTFQFSNVFNSVTGGNHEIVVIDANGCALIDSFTVTVNSSPIVTANTNFSVVCQGGTVTLTGGGANTYVWNNNVQNGVSFVPPATQNYTVTGTDVNGCINTDNITITVNSLPIVTANTNFNAVCQGASVTLTGNGASTYIWNNNVQNGISFAPPATQTYTVTGTDLNGCIDTANITITVNPLPIVTANTNFNAVCQGGSVTLTGGGANTYVWNNNVQNGVSFVPPATQNYTVTGTDANGCTDTDNITITVNPLPNVTATTNFSAVCQGGNVTLTGSGASTYIWNNNVQNGVSFAPSATQTYTVTGTDANGCTNTANITITVNPLPNVTATTNFSAVCQGGTVTLTGGGASTYIWNNNVQNGVSFVPPMTQSYIVTGTDANGCIDTANIMITVSPLPIVAANASSNPICQGDTIILTGSGASTYIWDSNVQDGVSFVPSNTHNYIVTGTDINGCINTNSVTVTVNPTPNPSIIVNGNVLSTQNYASYQWYVGGVIIIGATGQSYTPTTNGFYTVHVTDVNGCIGISLQISINNTALEDENEPLFMLYPNPTSGSFYIEFTQSDKYILTVYNVLGQLLFTKTIIGNKSEIDISKYAQGEYFVEILRSDNLKFVQKIVKE